MIAMLTKRGAKGEGCKRRQNFSFFIQLIFSLYSGCVRVARLLAPDCFCDGVRFRKKSSFAAIPFATRSPAPKSA
jgi:hypothetical protein